MKKSVQCSLFSNSSLFSNIRTWPLILQTQLCNLDDKHTEKSSVINNHTNSGIFDKHTCIRLIKQRILETDGIAYLSNGQKKLPLQPYEQYISYMTKMDIVAYQTEV